MIAEILSLFDVSVQADDEPRLVHSASFFEMPQVSLVDANLARWSRILSRIWTGATPLYKKTKGEYGFTDAERVPTHARDPLTIAFNDAVSIFGSEGTHLYLRHVSSRELYVARTSPPAVVAGGHVGTEPDTLRFRVGRAVELARAELLLAATLSDPDGELLLDAIGAAFGPPTLATDSSRDSLSLGASFWDTIPTRTQNELRRLLAQVSEVPTWKSLAQAAQNAGARAGLLFSGAIPTAAHALGRDEPTLADAELTTEQGYVAACQASQTLRSMLAFALSDSYLAARSHAISVAAS